MDPKEDGREPLGNGGDRKQVAGATISFGFIHKLFFLPDVRGAKSYPSWKKAAGYLLALIPLLRPTVLLDYYDFFYNPRGTSTNEIYHNEMSIKCNRKSKTCLLVARKKPSAAWS